MLSSTSKMEALFEYFCAGVSKEIVELAYKDISLRDKLIVREATSILIDFGTKCARLHRKTKLTQLHSNKKWGFVYVMYLCDNVYKIGRSDTPLARLKLLRSDLQNHYHWKNVNDVCLIHLIVTFDPNHCEKQLHQKYERQRISLSNFRSQETFELSTSDLEELTSTKVMLPHWFDPHIREKVLAGP